MLRRILVSFFLVFNFAVASLPAQEGNQSVAPAKISLLHFWLTPVMGGIGGGLIGAEGISYDKVKPGTVTIHRVRAGITYGAMGAATSSALMLKFSRPETSEPHRFLLDRLSTPLFAGMAAVQVLDYTGTRHFRARGRNEWLLTNGGVDDRPTLAATEVSAIVSAVSLAYVLHRTGHHKLERWFEAGYIVFGVASAAHNYSLGRLPPAFE